MADPLEQVGNLAPQFGVVIAALPFAYWLIYKLLRPATSRNISAVRMVGIFAIALGGAAILAGFIIVLSHALAHVALLSLDSS